VIRRAPWNGTESDESNQPLALLHTTVRKYGTVYNTVAPATALEGTMVRRAMTGD
jgi:hypothetical protein